MAVYLLLHKNITVAVFELNDMLETSSLMISKENLDYMPLPLKLLIHYKNGFVENESDRSYAINEEGRYRLDKWLGERTVPVDRDNVNRYKPSGMNTLTWMLKNHSTSLTDCYWTKEANEVLNWDGVKLYDNIRKIDRLSVIDRNREAGSTYANVNATLGGTLEKYWYYSNNNGVDYLMLAKRTELANSILNVRERIASKIYSLQGYEDFCQYYYIRNKHNQIVGCRCKAFTNEDRELITAYDLLAEHNETQSDDIYEKIIMRAKEYGADEEKVRKHLEIETVVDYLITNRDRHQNNIGFIRDSNTLKIVGVAPVYDSGSSKNLEGELPEGLNSKINGLYLTEKECIDALTGEKVIDLNKLPRDEWIREEINKAEMISRARKEKLFNLYISKKEYVRNLYSK